MVEKHPDLLNVAHNRFIEPFVGSGAVFFSVAPKTAVLCDRNERLIEVYLALKENWATVHEHLKYHQRKHCKDYYYEMRAKKCRTPITRAAQFIYLNRTCWNGLYRVNQQGVFNVPIGTKNSVLLPSDNFAEVARRLEGAELLSGDFELALARAGAGDFVFVDPPYTVKHNFNGFVKYNESIFSWDDQIRLRDCVREAVSRGAKVLVTNACHSSIREIYDGIGETLELQRASIIAGKASARGVFEEAVIKCY